MEISFSKDTYHTYMVVENDAAPDAEYEEKMMGNQQSVVLLPFHIQCVDGRKQYYYEITGKMDFRSCIEKRAADALVLENLIHCLVELCYTVDEHLLNLGSVLVAADYMYVDIETKRMYAAYVPGLQGDFSEALRTLSACLLEKTDHHDKEGVLLAYDLYRIIRQEDFTPGLLGDLLKRQEKGRVPEILEKPEPVEIYKAEKIRETGSDHKDVAEEKTSQSIKKSGLFLSGVRPFIGIGLWLLIFVIYRLGYLQMVLDRIGLALEARIAALLLMAVVLLLLVGSLFLEKRMRQFKKEKEEQDVWEDLEPGNQENKGIYAFTDMSVGESDQTVILSGAAGTIRLVSLNKNIADDLVITQMPCLLGSRRPDAEVIIGAVGISRKHALMEQLEDGIYLSDLHSTNGTFVNGERLKGDERKKLLFEDVIAFADVRYMYCGGQINGL